MKRDLAGIMMELRFWCINHGVEPEKLQLVVADDANYQRLGGWLKVEAGQLIADERYESRYISVAGIEIKLVEKR
jgi:hypothetical protein